MVMLGRLLCRWILYLSFFSYTVFVLYCTVQTSHLFSTNFSISCIFLICIVPMAIPYLLSLYIYNVYILWHVYSDFVLFNIFITYSQVLFSIFRLSFNLLRFNSIYIDLQIYANTPGSLPETQKTGPPTTHTSRQHQVLTPAYRKTQHFPSLCVLTQAVKNVPRRVPDITFGEPFARVPTSLRSKSWGGPRSSSGHLCLKCGGLCSHLCSCTSSPCAPASQRMCHLFKSPGKSIRALASITGWAMRHSQSFRSHGQEPSESAKNHYIIIQT